MKDGVRTEEQPEVSRQQLYEDYVTCYQLSPEVEPCRDACLLERAAQYLLREPEPAGTFTLFPFHQAVRHDCDTLSSDCRKHLSAVIRATEVLETLCVNLFLQPWRKEIRTLKAFTGPFVYCLLPVLSTSTIQSVLASIGYLPHNDTPPSEYRLSEDANPDRAMLLGFELLLARVECYRLLELLEKDHLGPQEWMEVLQRRVGPTKLEEPTEQKTTIRQKEEEEEKKKEGADRKEVHVNTDTRSDGAVRPQPKPRHHHFTSEDRSIMEMQMTYPDLAFRGRPLLPDKPESGSKDVHAASTDNCSDDSKTDCIKTAAATVSEADQVFGDDGRGCGCSDRNSGDAMSGSISHSDGNTVDDELGGPQTVSLHLTLRAGSKAEPEPTAELPARIQQHTAAELHNKRAAHPKLSSQSSVDEMQELKELSERMGQLHVHETSEDVKRSEEKTDKERVKKERKVSTEGEAGEPVAEAGPALRRSSSSQAEPTVLL